jgi:hypothetical protein
MLRLRTIFEFGKKIGWGGGEGLALRQFVSVNKDFMKFLLFQVL